MQTLAGRVEMKQRLVEEKTRAVGVGVGSSVSD
jgi:hypothetical protein